MNESEKDITRITHMIQAGEKIGKYIAGHVRHDLDTDEGLLLIITRLIEILGEAARHITIDTKNLDPEIPWKEITGIRDKLIHGYFDIDHEIIWLTTKQDVPELIDKLKNLYFKLKGKEYE